MEKQYFNVGDKVTCSAHGKGVVVRIDDEIKYTKYTIHVHFGDIYPGSEIIHKHYTFDGFMDGAKKRTLHQGHIDIPEPELKEIVTFEKGEIVWGMDNCNKWHCVKFEEFNPDFPQRILASHPQENAVYCAKEYYDIRKYEDRPF